VLYPKKQKKWLAENFDILKKYGKKSVLTTEQYQLKITQLRDIIKGNDNCKSRMYGESLTIKINSKRLQYRKNFRCNIILLNFVDN
jgi:hypothetical protein